MLAVRRLLSGVDAAQRPAQAVETPYEEGAARVTQTTVSSPSGVIATRGGAESESISEPTMKLDPRGFPAGSKRRAWTDCGTVFSSVQTNTVFPAVSWAASTSSCEPSALTLTWKLWPALGGTAAREGIAPRNAVSAVKTNRLLFMQIPPIKTR